MAHRKTTTINYNRHMKTTMIVKSMLAAVLLLGTASILEAQTTTRVCPFGYEPGYGRSMNAEQRAQHRVVVQQKLAELRQKQANGTATAEEQAWLKQVEQRGGMCINGIPRGWCGGRGYGAGNCAGGRQGRGQGLRDGTGPRSVDGTCPNTAPARRGNRP